MSHAVNIKTAFTNISNLLAQFEQRGWKIVENQKCNTYPSDPRRNEVHQYVAKNPKPGGYDVGVNLDSDGTAYFVCDFFDHSIGKQLGSNLKDIKQGYALSELQKQLKYEDLSYKVSELASGELVVVAE
jgi:hypothetical protein